MCLRIARQQSLSLATAIAFQRFLYGASLVPGFLFLPVERDTKMSFADNAVMAVNAISIKKAFLRQLIMFPRMFLIFDVDHLELPTGVSDKPHIVCRSQRKRQIICRQRKITFSSPHLLSAEWNRLSNFPEVQYLCVTFWYIKSFCKATLRANIPYKKQFATLKNKILRIFRPLTENSSTDY